MDEQSRERMNFTSGRLASALTRFRPWMEIPGPAPSWPGNLDGIDVFPRFYLFKLETYERQPINRQLIQTILYQ